MRLNDVLAELRSMGNPKALAGMIRYGIKADRALGISIPKLQRLAKKIGKNHKLAEDLWSSAIHEARILACMIDEPQRITKAQLERWVNEFDSWDTSVPPLLDRTGLKDNLPDDGRPILIKPNLVEALDPPITTPAQLVFALVDYLQSITQAQILRSYASKRAVNTIKTFT